MTEVIIVKLGEIITFAILEPNYEPMALETRVLWIFFVVVLMLELSKIISTADK